MKKSIIATLLFLFLAFPAFGADFDLVLQWDENTEPDLATGERPRYKIYYKTDTSGANKKSNFASLPLSEFQADEGPTTVNVTVAKDENPDPAIVQFTLHNLEDSQDYYLAVTALDEAGNESDLSNEVAYEGIERVAPVIDLLTVNGQAGPITTNNGDIAIRLQAHDDTLIAGYIIQIDDAKFDDANIVKITPVQSMDLTVNKFLVDDGNHIIYAYVVDEYEGIADLASVSVKLDTTPPAKPNLTVWQIIWKAIKGWFK